MNDLTIIYQGSPDLTPEWFKEFVESAKPLGVKLSEVSSKTSIIGAIRQIRTPFYMSVDPCDLLVSDTLSANLNTIRDYPHMAMIGAHLRYINRRGQRRGVAVGNSHALARMQSDPLAVYRSAIYRHELVVPILNNIEGINFHDPEYAIRLALAAKHQCEVTTRCGYMVRFRDNPPYKTTAGISYKETPTKLKELGLL